nr:hypothetical protein Iba_scaffold29487CG0030 [Ipomoea batatas]GME17534.1 hypothetical protein Iba_scaffold18920CG0460 [Ipomoea batatas]
MKGKGFSKDRLRDCWKGNEWEFGDELRQIGALVGGLEIREEVKDMAVWEPSSAGEFTFKSAKKWYREKRMEVLEVGCRGWADECLVVHGHEACCFGLGSELMITWVHEARWCEQLKGKKHEIWKDELLLTFAAELMIVHGVGGWNDWKNELKEIVLVG